MPTVIKGIWAGRPGAGSIAQRQRATALAEYALVLPIIVLFLALSIQMALIVIQYYSVMHITRETARWLSINPDSFDSAVQNRANTLRASLPGVNNTAFTSAEVVPGPTSCTVLNAQNHCTGRDAGTSVSVTITANVSSVLIFPSTLQVFNWRFSFPTSLPAYRVTAMIE